MQTPYQKLREELTWRKLDAIRRLLHETQAEKFLLQQRGRQPERVVGLTVVETACKDALRARGVAAKDKTLEVAA